MQQSGYNTYYTGKMYNGQDITNYNKPFILGYNESDLLLDPLTYQYYNFAATRNSEPVRKVSGKYSPDFTAETAYEFLDLALEDEENPFFITIAPIAPHCEGIGAEADPPQSADRHKHLYKDYKIPRTSNFNPDDPIGVSWVRNMEKMNKTVVGFNDEYQRQRLRSIQAVDEMVEEVVRRLDDAGVLGETHVFFSSDNGYHIGQHRLHPGKMLGYEEDIRVPLVWRGPGIPAGETREFPTSHSDLAPTIMKLAGLNYDDRSFDGAPIDLDAQIRWEHVGIEYWGPAKAESQLSVGAGGMNGTYDKNTYKGLRLEAEDYSYYYSVWCTLESEHYDMRVSLCCATTALSGPFILANSELRQNDPGQMKNLLDRHSDGTYVKKPEAPVLRAVDRLDALTLVLKSCKGKTCTHPWEALHPDGNVKNFAEAMNCKYDEFYSNQPKVSFDECSFGYIIDIEGPQNHNEYRMSRGVRTRQMQQDDDWSFWV